MKIAFIFDTKLIKKENDFYGMTLTYDFFKNRYLCLFDEVIVVTRIEKNKNERGYRQTNGENVIVNPIYSYNNILDSIIKRKEIEQELESVVKSVDKVIIRMPSVLGGIAAKICQSYNKSYIIEMVACAWDGYKNHTNKLGKIVAPIMYFKTKKCIKNAPKVLYVTNKFLQKRYPTKGESISCSDVMLKKMDCNIIDKRIEKIENNNSNIIKLCTIANIDMRYKGHEYVIKALSKLKNTKKSFIYYIVGNGNSKRLEKIAQKNGVKDMVIFEGSLPHDQVFKKLDEIDIYIQPSLQEGLPRALLEAMSRACPAIASDAGGNIELLNSKYIFKRKKVNQIIKILKKFDKVAQKDAAIENFKRIQNYDAEVLNKKRKEFYIK